MECFALESPGTQRQHQKGYQIDVRLPIYVRLPPALHPSTRITVIQPR
ncbi:MAG: hypothetical protein F6J93_07090 [Oscillatoria sp. SIO1A7]|nr:hypothetical protein [Oscillatoria sp. SIO1A7]